MIDFNNVAELLPHSGQMILLDRIIEFGSDRLTAQVTVRADGLFTDADKTPAWVGIEYMAQAIGAYVGIKAKLAGEPIKLGYLLGTRRYTSNVPSFAPGIKLFVSIKTIIQDDKLGVFDCTIQGDGIDISANLNVYQPPIDITFEMKS